MPTPREPLVGSPPLASGDAPDAGLMVAGYRLLRQLGQGRHGSVYLAQDERRGRSVALKVVPLPAGSDADAAAQTFLRAAEAARGLRHPGIVRLYAAGVEGPLAWLAMEAVPGSDLSRYSTTSRLLPELLVVRTIERVAWALDHAHRSGVVHRDVKPANVLVNWPSDTIKLADFGLAREGDGLQTGSGIVLGSPAYMAPEQLAGAVPTPRSDLYGLGVTLFQMLTGRLPFEGDSMGALLQQVAEAPVPELRLHVPDAPSALSQLTGLLLAKRATDRPAHAAEVARALAQVAQAWPPVV